MWDREDRDADAARLDRGELVLERGHETPSSTVLDGVWDEVLEMPSESWAPISLAAALAAVFVMLLLGHWVLAAALTGIAGMVLLAWHAKEPQEA